VANPGENGIEPGFVTRLARRYAGLHGEQLLEPLIGTEFTQEIALVSSFGVDLVVLLHMISRISPATPVIFLNTNKHFPETLAYRHDLVRFLGLKDVRDIEPDLREVARLDGDGRLHADNYDACCNLRKVQPLERALNGFEARITGRKRFQSQGRSLTGTIGWAGDHVAINPLAIWTTEDLKSYILKHDLPRHPLVHRGFASIGCAPCTTSVEPGEHMLAGRWRNSEKTECGIHPGVDGSFVQTHLAG